MVPFGLTLRDTLEQAGAVGLSSLAGFVADVYLRWRRDPLLHGSSRIRRLIVLFRRLRIAAVERRGEILREMGWAGVATQTLHLAALTITELRALCSRVRRIAERALLPAIKGVAALLLAVILRGRRRSNLAKTIRLIVSSAVIAIGVVSEEYLVIHLAPFCGVYASKIALLLSSIGTAAAMAVVTRILDAFDLESARSPTAKSLESLIDETDRQIVAATTSLQRLRRSSLIAM